MRRRLYVGAAAFALAGGLAAGLALAFSGGDAKPSRAAYVADVSAACSRYGRQLDLIPPPADIAAPGEIVGSVGRALPLLRQEAAEIRALPPPETLKPRLQRFFVLTDRSIAELARTLAAAQRRDLGAMGRGLARFVAARNAARELSEALGFRC